MSALDHALSDDAMMILARSTHKHPECQCEYCRMNEMEAARPRTYSMELGSGSYEATMGGKDPSLCDLCSDHAIYVVVGHGRYCANHLLDGGYERLNISIADE